jgi:hypothetical protein
MLPICLVSKKNLTKWFLKVPNIYLNEVDFLYQANHHFFHHRFASHTRIRHLSPAQNKKKSMLCSSETTKMLIWLQTVKELPISKGWLSHTHHLKRNALLLFSSFIPSLRY